MKYLIKKLHILITICFSIFIIFFSSYLFAVGPLPGLYFYRADTRIPDEIFGVGEAPGAGFVTWASSRGVPANNNVLDYLGGVSVRPAPAEERNAGWVSVSGDIFAVDNFLQTEIVPQYSSEPPPIEARSQWVYQISPSEDAFNVNWMIRNAVQQSTDQARIQQLLRFLAFASEDEWIVRGGIPSAHIHSARNFLYNTSTREFEPNGQPVFNPNYVEPSRPQPQTENLVLTENVPNTVYGFADPQPHGDQATVAPPLAYSSSCASVARHSSPSRYLTKPSLPKPSACDLSQASLKTISFKETPTIISQLPVDTGYCLQPVGASTQALLWTRSYLWMDHCNNKSAQKAYYDIAGRIVVPKDEEGISVCLTAPENVLAGKTQWDYVQFWPCDLENPNQRWRIKNGKIYSQLEPDLYIKFSGWYGLMSQNNKEGYNSLLLRKKMTQGFFDDPSMIGDSNIEIGLSWNGSVYYPTGNLGYSENYEDRTYYNLQTGQIGMLSYGHLVFPGRAASRYWRCLTSKQSDGNSWWAWDWAHWASCDANAKNQKWTIDNNAGNVNKNPIESVGFKDAAGNSLYFNLYNSINYGAPYTQKGQAGWGAAFNLYRSYGVCTSIYNWNYCLTTKHSYSENGGIW